MPGKKGSKKKWIIRTSFVVFLLLLPVAIFASNPWTGACDGLPLRLRISVEDEEIEAWSNSTIEVDVTLRNKGPMLFAMDDPEFCGTRKLYIETPDFSTVYSHSSPNCLPNVIFFGPFRSDSWTMTAGGSDFDSDHGEFGKGQGNESGFRFNEPGEYRLWVEYRSSGRENDDDSKPRSIDRTVISNIIKIHVK